MEIGSEKNPGMTAEDLLTTMRRAIADEREAIRHLDVLGIARASDMKEAVLARLRDTPPAERAPLYAALDGLKADLHCNLILLTHARAYLREAQLETARERSSAVTVPPPSQMLRAG
jgi:hypothetical protein